jgi:GNAT superfamily N-acetyltransferase
MDAIEHSAIVRLGLEDAAAGLALSTEVFWNQNEADWRFFLTQGIVFGIRDSNERLIATAALLPYTSGNAWISMVLVTAIWRRRGLATRLIDTCLAEARKQGFVSWLDATPAGATVYEPLGFGPTIQLQRLRLESATPSEAPASQPVLNENLDEFIARDRRAMGFDRSALLSELTGRSGSRVFAGHGVVGLIRNGRKARHIGPLYADGEGQALKTVHDIIRHEASPILIDVVSSNDEFLKGLMRTGWIIERPFQRMRYGHSTGYQANLAFAVAGPEYG